MSSEKWVYLNSGFVEEKHASLPISDLGFLRGYGVFDFFRLVNNKPLFLDHHLERFYRSAAGLLLEVPFSPVELKDIIHELMDRNRLPVSGIRITLTGGPSPDGYLPGKPTLLLTQQPMAPVALVEGGLRLALCRHQRQMPGVKTIDYLMGVRLQPEVREGGADDALYHWDGKISECPRSNIFVVTREGQLVTPADGVLSGITRHHVLSVAADMDAAETGITLEMLRTAREVFVTSTSKAITPVAAIGDLAWNTSAYSLTPLLQQRFANLVEDDIRTYKY